MPLEHHPLNREFPDHRRQMLNLLQHDARFSRLAQEYKSLDDQVYAAEDGRQPLDALALQGLKSQRVTLKDQIAQLLQQPDK
ncbi:DUF465 domain-containing protein [Pseudomonas sp. LS44]|uniref:YdcH family protein n=1 Tax=Pseudomonas sp. LS44 TaxID=1357074 RepID=UPI00215B26D3|nr:DUF465 domain-containing protein [Pseudomonas sp. LS44]UVE17141.1 DUF465 domain-containing protein [Pseudomonas sp. LS44]